MKKFQIIPDIVFEEPVHIEYGMEEDERIIDYIVDDKTMSPMDYVNYMASVEAVHSLIEKSNLTPRMKEVLCLRYGINDGILKTQKEVAKLLGVSGANVGEIERAAIKRLRKKRNISKYREYL